MKSGLEDRNNPSFWSVSAPDVKMVSMKSGLEDRNNAGPAYADYANDMKSQLSQAWKTGTIC